MTNEANKPPKRNRARSAQSIQEQHAPKPEAVVEPENSTRRRFETMNDPELLAFVQKIYGIMGLRPSQEDLKGVSIVEGTQDEFEQFMKTEGKDITSGTFFTVVEPSIAGYSSIRMKSKKMTLEKVIKTAVKRSEQGTAFGGLKLMEKLYEMMLNGIQSVDERNEGMYLFPGVYIFQDYEWFMPAVRVKPGGIMFFAFQRGIQEHVNFDECVVAFHL